MIHIYQPQSFLARQIIRCGCCKTRRRFVVTLYGWYSGRYTCCHCGAVYCEGLRRESSRQRKANAERARKQWQTAKPIREAIAEMLANT